MHASAPVRRPSNAERFARVRLARSGHVGPVTFRRLLDRFGSAEAAIDALPRLPAGRSRPVDLCPRETIEAEIAATRALGARLVVWGDPDYPARLAEIADPPPVFSVLGDVSLLATPSVAIVGARNASAGGQRLAEAIATDLARAGFTIVSGLARGIDAAAHRGALAGGTVAVVAGGADVIYPPENRDLHADIAGRGAIVAELSPGAEPQARHFPRRNRIIAGLAMGAVVIEAALGSGSLITARVALEEGREVFAVPGSPLDPRSRGGNDLIRQGAVLTESANDVLQALAALLPPQAPARPRPAPSPETAAPAAARPAPRPAPAPDDRPGAPAAAGDPRSAVLAGLGPAPVTVDELVRRCQLSPAEVSAVLLDLELDGHVERHPGHKVSLA